MTGIVNINKPQGRSSHFVVAVVRRITGIKKVGHTGTLDPIATGVLPVCIGRESTKLSQKIMDGTKGYRAVVQLGKTTTTQDETGEVLTDTEVLATKQEIMDVIASFQGDILQVPPMYSAIKMQGRKLYEYARKGIEVERRPRKVTIYEIKASEFDEENHTVQIDVHCSKGTYIRTLCESIGEKLGCGAYMKSLVRTKCGDFLLEDSITLEQFEQAWKSGQLDGVLLSPARWTDGDQS